jgi:peroxiredoxin
MPAYEADMDRFKSYDAHVLGISVDSVPCNTAWAKSLGGLSYDLLSDFHPKGEVARAYGAYREADGISERALFVVGKDGKIAYKNTKVVPADDAKKVTQFITDADKK